MNNTIIEMVSYQLKAGISKEQLAATHEQLNTFLQAQVGFIYRSVSQDDDGLLFDVVYWQDMASAKLGGEAFMADKAGQALIALTDEQSITMRHMPVLSQVLGECGN